MLNELASKTPRTQREACVVPAVRVIPAKAGREHALSLERCSEAAAGAEKIKGAIAPLTRKN